MDRATVSDRPLSIVVLLGGWSSEREVSLASGSAVVRALRSRGHDVRELDPAEIDFFTYPWFGVDAAFIALHGAFGEDGTVQSLLDQLGVPYTGSDARASRLAMSKSATKERLIGRALPTPSHVTMREGLGAVAVIEKAARVGYPLVVKPDAQGSSIGVSMVQNHDQLFPAIDDAFRYDPLVLLERYVPGRELTVAVLESRALPTIEVRPARPFFDYKAKYQDESTAYGFDLDLPQALLEGIEGLALAAVTTVGARGASRVDLRLDPESKPWLLEVNTSPGLTDHSLVPKAAARAGIGFAELCEELVLAKLVRPPETRGNQAA